jgi:hypothetical protein
MVTRRPARRLQILAALACSLFPLSCGSRSRSADEMSPRDRRPAHHITQDAAVLASTDAATPPPPALPKALSLEALGEGERIADLAALGLEDRMLLAWVTYVDPGALPPARHPVLPRPVAKVSGSPQAASQEASVMVRLLDKDGQALSQPNVISPKADSIGGVALAAGRGGRGDVALAWVGKDGPVGQVFLARLSRSGEKQMQRMLTRSKGGCSDVGIAPTQEGFVVTWVDNYRDYAEVCAARVGRDLQRMGTERRVARAKGEASDLRVLARDDEVLLAWNEVRTEESLSGIFATRLMSGDLTMRGDPVRIALTSGHARGLEVSRFEDGVVFGWIEDTPARPAGAGAQRRTVVLARVDASVRTPPEPVRVPIAAEASSIALDCTGACRVVVPAAEQGVLSLYGFAFDGARPTDVPAHLASITGVSTEDISPVMVRDWLFFAEDNLHGGGRVRIAKIAWP